MIWILTAALLFPLSPAPLSPADGSAAETEAPKPPKLAFKNDEAKASFLAGFEKFHEGQWKDAGTDFRAALRGVEKRDKPTLQGFVNAAKDGPKTDSIGDQLMEQKYRKAYQSLLKLEKKHHDDPLSPRIDVFFKELNQTLFHVLDDYEMKAVDLDKDDKDQQRKAIEEILKTALRDINKNLDYVRRGKQSLKWKASGGRELWGYRASSNFVRFDGELLEKYRYLNLSIYGPRTTKATIIISIDPSAEPNFRVGTSMDKSTDIFTTEIPKNRWTDLRIDLRNSKVRKILEANDVFGFRIQMAAPKNDQTLYIDEVKLEIP